VYDLFAYTHGCCITLLDHQREVVVGLSSFASSFAYVRLRSGFCPATAIISSFLLSRADRLELSSTALPTMTLHPSHPPPPPSARPLFQQSQPSSTTTHPFLSSSSSSKPSTQNKGSTSSGSQPDTPPLIISPRSSSSAAAPPPSTGALPQSYTTQLSDLLLSAVVPGIPKGTAAGKGAGGKASGGGVKAGDVVGGVRVLSSKKEELNLSSMTNNFR
jgi:hypothetical protein